MCEGMAGAAAAQLKQLAATRRQVAGGQLCKRSYSRASISVSKGFSTTAAAPAAASATVALAVAATFLPEEEVCRARGGGDDAGADALA